MNFFFCISLYTLMKAFLVHAQHTSPYPFNSSRKKSRPDLSQSKDVAPLPTWPQEHGDTWNGEEASDSPVWQLQVELSTPRESEAESKPTQEGGAGKTLHLEKGAQSEDPAMEDFWREFEHFKEDQYEQDALVIRTPEAGEQEEAWLQEAGLATLVQDVGDIGATAPSLGSKMACVDDGMVLLSTLTRAQAAAVLRRLDTYNQTVRKKSRPVTRDVREIFPSTDVTARPGLENGLHYALRAAAKEDSFEEDRHQEDSRNVHGEIEDGQASCESSWSRDHRLDRDDITREDLRTEVPYSDQVISACEKLHRDLRNGFLSKIPGAWTERLGQTRVKDLSLQDMKKVRFLALIELTAFFDALGIELKRSKAIRAKVKEGGLFGVPLCTLLEQDQKRVPGTRIPLIMQRLLQHLEDYGLCTEGILRVPGSVGRVKTLRQDLEMHFYGRTFDWDAVRGNDAATLLKLFLRELPYPLLTLEYLAAFTSIQDIPSQKQQLQALNLLIMLLPDPNRDMLQALLVFLHKVCIHEKYNRMSVRNVALVMAPNLFLPRRSPTEVTGSRRVGRSGTGIASITRLLINYQQLLWTVPVFLVQHVRHLNAAQCKKRSRDRSKKRFLRKTHSEREKRSEWNAKESEVPSVPEGIIRVQAPQLFKVSMAIQLDSSTTADTILDRFQSSLAGRRSVTYHLMFQNKYISNLIQLLV
uniref:Rho GTPase activating protein 18 n=1 Tax=Eptatretus burgeri TaxID=7764 RepID=A0A8C4R7D2_EPTBU